MLPTILCSFGAYWYLFEGQTKTLFRCILSSSPGSNLMIKHKYRVTSIYFEGKLKRQHSRHGPGHGAQAGTAGMVCRAWAASAARRLSRPGLLQWRCPPIHQKAMATASKQAAAHRGRRQRAGEGVAGGRSGGRRRRQPTGVGMRKRRLAAASIKRVGGGQHGHGGVPIFFRLARQESRPVGSCLVRELGTAQPVSMIPCF
ncbi:hypothetical protein PAHAL_4G018100 [Panicum hallii]|uniref:Uncharacterized protein n=1 Tax=Panicum hallii TaxID=206008 RepID=A0A2T8JBH5_9POAL|nr:hypothetical protein PAHAL_4G018100 [Panicum hallii]